MADIAYVCLSDMHLGADNSLLTGLSEYDVTPRTPSPVMQQLVVCLRSLISRNLGGRKPTLILNGDILELALANDNYAAMTFECFIREAMPERNELFSDITYIPGNHDHHLWETAREAQYVHFITTDDEQKKPEADLEVPWHTTKLFCERADLVPSMLLNGIINRLPHLRNFKVGTAYPNYGIHHPQRSRCVIFSHGHFTESIYTLMSQLRCKLFSDSKMPEQVWDLEAENFAWIDFFWSTMGRSGDVGRDVELVYNRMQDPDKAEKLLRPVALELLEKLNVPGHVFERFVYDHIVGKRLGQMISLERHEPLQLLTDDYRRTMIAYFRGPVLNQIKSELSENLPESCAFIFGHTHKPFQYDMEFAGYRSAWTEVYNSGGWVVDTDKPQKLHSGAVILVDEDLNTASLRMYNERVRAEDYQVKVACSTHDGGPPNAFYEQVREAVAEDECWDRFAELIPAEVKKRAATVLHKMNAPE